MSLHTPTNEYSSKTQCNGCLAENNRQKGYLNIKYFYLI